MHVHASGYPAGRRSPATAANRRPIGNFSHRGAAYHASGNEGRACRLHAAVYLSPMGISSRTAPKQETCLLTLADRSRSRVGRTRPEPEPQTQTTRRLQPPLPRFRAGCWPPERCERLRPDRRVGEEPRRWYPVRHYQPCSLICSQPSLMAFSIALASSGERLPAVWARIVCRAGARNGTS